MNKEQYTEKVIEISNTLRNLRNEVAFLSSKCNRARKDSPELAHEWQIRRVLLEAMNNVLDAAQFYCSELWF